MNIKRKNRGRLEIINDILDVINKSKVIRPTKLMHKSNLSPDLYKEYVNFLVKDKFVQIDLIKKNNVREYSNISILKRGKDYLNDYKNIKEFLIKYGLEV